MFEIKLVTADRAQVRRKRELEEYKGIEWLDITLDNLLKTDIPLDRVSIYNDNQNFEYGEQSQVHIDALNRARSLGIRVVQNRGNGFSNNAVETLKEPLRFEDTKYIIFLEDDIDIYPRILEETTKWIDSLNPTLKFGLLFNAYNTPTVEPLSFGCSQGLIFEKNSLKELIHVIENYDEMLTKPHGAENSEMFDMQLARSIAYHFKCPLYNCTPSLVQHIGGLESSWVGVDEFFGGIRNTEHFKK
jgi:hypothetical protein